MTDYSNFLIDRIKISDALRSLEDLKIFDSHWLTTTEVKKAIEALKLAEKRANSLVERERQKLMELKDNY